MADLPAPIRRSLAIERGFPKRPLRPYGRPTASLNINPMYQLRQANEFGWEVAGANEPKGANHLVLGNLSPT